MPQPVLTGADAQDAAVQEALVSPDNQSMTGTSLALTVAQTDVWRAQKLAPGSTLYNIGGYIEISGQVNPARIAEAAAQAVRQAGSSFLFRFVETDSGPRQVPVAWAPVEVPFVDLSGSADPSARAADWMRAALDRPFDLAAAPAFRLALLEVAEDRFFLFSAYHHLVTDGFGASLFLRRIGEQYSAATGGPSPAALTPWVEVVRNEEEYRSSEQCARDRAFWLERLRDHPEPVTFSGQPLGLPAAKVASVGSISRATLERLSALSPSPRSGLVAVFFAALAVYLSRRSGSRDLVFGMPVAARPNPGLRRSGGFLTNTVPLRLAVDPGARFSKLVEHTAARIREAFRHQRYWSSALRRDLGLSANDPNVYGTVLNFLPNEADLDFAGQPARIHAFTHAPRVEDLSITLHAATDGSDMAVQFDGNRTRYDEQSLHRHCRDFLKLLETLASDADVPLHALPLIDARERQQILKEWSGKPFTGASETLLEQFERHANQTPDATALVSSTRRLSYAELQGHAHQLAQRLIEQGVAQRVWLDCGLIARSKC